MSSSPLLAVVVPSYNQGRFIRQTIDSILSQSSVKAEVLVMDGGSTDETLNILKSYGKKITWISKKDKGQSDAINKGLTTFLKKYRDDDEVIFAYLNSDDYYHARAFEQVVKVFSDRLDCQWLVGECQIVDAQGKKIQQAIQFYKKIWRYFLSWPILLCLNPLPQPAIFIRLSTVRKVGLFNQKLKYTMDYEYWLRLWECVGAPAQSSAVLASFRIHGQSKGSTRYQEQFIEQYHVARQQGASMTWLLLQSMHNKLITTVYSLIK